MKKTLCILLCCILMFSSGCKPDIPSLEEVSQYSEEELRNFAKSINLEQLRKAWGESKIVNGQNIWTIDLTGSCEFLSVWPDNDGNLLMSVSSGLFVTVVLEKENTFYGLVGYDSYSTDSGTLTVLPDIDYFGQKINYHIGDLYYCQFDGMIFETYPAQINRPFSAMLMGQLTDSEINELSNKIVLP